MSMRFGLIGCGGIGVLRAKAIKKTPGCQLTAVSDVDEARAKSVSGPYGGAVELDWQEMVKRDDVDAVIVSTPPHLHAQMCIGALKAGKHVLCEKPLARTPDECRSILEAAKQSKGFLATGFNYRFYPSILKAKELLDTGIIGELDHIRSYTGYSATAHNHDWLHDAKVMGGGALRDNGIHLIDLTCYFLGEVAEVKGFSSEAVWGFTGCEDNGFALIRSTQDKIASVQASWTEWRGYRLKVELYGSRGCISASCFPMVTQARWSKDLGGKTQRKSYYFPWTHIGEHLFTYEWVVIDSFVKEMDAFVRAAGGDTTTEIASGQDGLRAIGVAHGACESSKQKPTDAARAWA